MGTVVWVFNLGCNFILIKLSSPSLLQVLRLGYFFPPICRLTCLKPLIVVSVAKRKAA